MNPVSAALPESLPSLQLTAPIIGATQVQHLEDAVGALSLALSGEENAALEEPYLPHAVVGFS